MIVHINSIYHDGIQPEQIDNEQKFFDQLKYKVVDFNWRYYKQSNNEFVIRKYGLFEDGETWEIILYSLLYLFLCLWVPIFNTLESIFSLTSPTITLYPECFTIKHPLHKLLKFYNPDSNKHQVFYTIPKYNPISSNEIYSIYLKTPYDQRCILSNARLGTAQTITLILSYYLQSHSNTTQHHEETQHQKKALS